MNHYMDEYKKYFDPKFYEKPLKIHKKYLETTWRKSFMADNEPKVLTLSDLEFGFVVWFGSLIVPLIAFIIEYLSRLAQILMFKRILSSYFEQKKCIALNISQMVEEKSKMEKKNYRKESFDHDDEIETITLTE
jgi:hypothetical protein